MKQEEEELISSLVSQYGVYAVAQVLSNIANFSSEDYRSQGNTGAIIHKDAETMGNAVNIMMLSHPMRIMKYEL